MSEPDPRCGNCWGDPDPAGNCGLSIGMFRSVFLAGQRLDISDWRGSTISQFEGEPCDFDNLPEEVQRDIIPINATFQGVNFERCVSFCGAVANTGQAGDPDINGASVPVYHYVGSCDATGATYNASLTPDPVPNPSNPGVACCKNWGTNRIGAVGQICHCYFGVYFAWTRLTPGTVFVNGQEKSWSVRGSVIWYLLGRSQSALPEGSGLTSPLRFDSLIAFARTSMDYTDLNGVAVAAHPYLYGSGCGRAGQVDLERTSVLWSFGGGFSGLPLGDEDKVVVTGGSMSWSFPDDGIPLDANCPNYGLW